MIPSKSPSPSNYTYYCIPFGLVCALTYVSNCFHITYTCYSSKYYKFLFDIVIIIYSLELFTSALADGLSLKFEWQQVSSSLLDFSRYSGRSQ